ncbi:MAG: lipopolysaccharide assembly protein LapB [Gammaproteobacteria bacterium]
MYELLWLLLPVAAASGWLIGRGAKQPRDRNPEFGMRTAYFRGLNYLLNEQPDKAIEVFVKILEVDSETVETHLALGNLFRRRGEVDRAIRIHQNLIARPALSKEQKAEALLELGQDYMRAGLFDRAENIFLELINMRMHADAARAHLLDIYQQEKEWESAIDVVRSLTTLSQPERQLLIGQFYCELADEAIAKSDFQMARQMLRKALSADPQCVRASITEGDLAVRRADYKSALRAYRRVEEQNRDYLPEVISSLRECYEKLGDREGFIGFLRQVQQHYQGMSVLLALAEEIRRKGDEGEANAFLVEQLGKKPSVRGLDWLLEKNLDQAEGKSRENLLVLRKITQALLEQKPAYLCSRCGYSAKSLHWHCPSCKSWSSIKQVQGVAGE